MGWERFHGLEVIGFIAMVVGTCIYNKVISLSTIIVLPASQQQNGIYTNGGADERSPLLSPSKLNSPHPNNQPVPIVTRPPAGGGANASSTAANNGAMRYMIRSFRMGGYSLFSSNSSGNLAALPSPSPSPSSPRAALLRRNVGIGFGGPATPQEQSGLGLNDAASVSSSVFADDPSLTLDEE